MSEFLQEEKRIFWESVKDVDSVPYKERRACWAKAYERWDTVWDQAMFFDELNRDPEKAAKFEEGAKRLREQLGMEPK